MYFDIICTFPETLIDLEILILGLFIILNE